MDESIRRQAIRSEHNLSEFPRMYIEIEGIPQWIQIESDDPKNPVILLVHGGPGASTGFASAAWQSWRRHFTLVHWDQRGAGRTFAKNGAEGSQPMSFEQIVRDGLAVTEFLRGHLKHERIYLLGHSWGSAIGVHMVKRRPDLFAAFIGTGQLVNFEQNEQINYQRELKQARQSQNEEAIAALTEIGPPPHNDPNSVRILREWSDKLTTATGDAPQPQFRSAGFSKEDRDALIGGFMFSVGALFPELCRVDLPSLGTNFEIPMFCLMGTHDQQTPIELAERYFKTINAPHKEFVRFEGCHHFVHMNRPEEFLEALVKLLLR